MLLARRSSDAPVRPNYEFKRPNCLSQFLDVKKEPVFVALCKNSRPMEVSKWQSELQFVPQVGRRLPLNFQSWAPN